MKLLDHPIVQRMPWNGSACVFCRCKLFNSPIVSCGRYRHFFLKIENIISQRELINQTQTLDENIFKIMIILVTYWFCPYCVGDGCWLGTNCLARLFDIFLWLWVSCCNLFGLWNVVWNVSWNAWMEP